MRTKGKRRSNEYLSLVQWRRMGSRKCWRWRSAVGLLNFVLHAFVMLGAIQINAHVYFNLIREEESNGPPATERLTTSASFSASTLPTFRPRAAGSWCCGVLRIFTNARVSKRGYGRGASVLGSVGGNRMRAGPSEAQSRVAASERRGRPAQDWPRNTHGLSFPDYYYY